MATAFTPREREAIGQALLRSALRHAAGEGLRKTTVELLAADAGISKGAFYTFYDSKEHLFLAVLEILHAEMYGSAEQALAGNAELPIRQRVTKAVLAVCSVLRQHRMSRFIQQDVPLLLRKLPQRLLDEHYQSDAVHIRRLMTNESFRLSVPVETACAIVRMLMLTLIYEPELGAEYPQALEVMVGAVCDRVVLA